MKQLETDILVIGAGSVGIAVAYYLKKLKPDADVTLIDCGQPMAFTSAQSGENYRNWWPHPLMRAFTDHSIDLMEEITRSTDNRIMMTRRGYVLATRETNIEGLLADMEAGYKGSDQNEIRQHSGYSAGTYQQAETEDWELAPNGVDILTDKAMIEQVFPYFEKDVRSILHIRRAGMISGQQMGQYMLDVFRSSGGKRGTGNVVHIDKGTQFTVHIEGTGPNIAAERIVNAAGPFVGEIATMVGVDLPVQNWLQQKIAFEDTKKAIPRQMPFSIDLDPQYLDWSTEERELLVQEPEFSWLAGELPGSVHCRPEGGDRGTWIKMGWAYNQSKTPVTFDPAFDDQFPEIVLRGAARLNPALKAYYGQLPRAMVHYGGYYTLTDENWPLLGPTDVNGFYVAGALSGFGTMAACSSGELVAQSVLGLGLPDYAEMLSPQRYRNPRIVSEMQKQQNRGIL